MESDILLRIKHFEQGRRGVAVNRTFRHFVYLVEDEDGVRTACSLHSLNDSAWHCADVSASVATNLALVVNATQTHSDILPAKRFCNALSEACFSHSRRAIEADDRTLAVLAHLQDCEVLQNAFLHLLHTIMVAIEFLLSRRYVGVVFGAFVPRKSHNRLKILKLHIIVRRLNVDAVQLRKFFIKDIAYLLAPMLLRSLFPEVRDIFLTDTRLVFVAQLCLDVLNLLTQEVLPLLLVEVASSLVLNLSLELHQLDDVVGKLDGLLQSSEFGRAGEELILLLDGERHVAAYRIEHEGRWLHIVDVLRQLIWNVVEDAHQPSSPFLE